MPSPRLLPPTAADPLRRLEAIRFDFGPERARERRGLLARAWRRRFHRAKDLLRLHDDVWSARYVPERHNVWAALAWAWAARIWSMREPSFPVASWALKSARAPFAVR